MALNHPRRLLFAGIACLWLITGSSLATEERTPVSSFSLNSLGGDTIALADYKDSVLLVNFWASWCPPCVHELPSMQALRQSMDGLPFEILALNMGEHRKRINNFRENFKTNLEFPILLNADRNMPRDWQVRALPTSMLIDKKGRLVQTITGPRDWNGKKIKKLILTLLDE